MRYSVLDRVEEIDPGRAGVGVKLSTRADDAYCPEWVGRCLTGSYPWTLVLEAAFQLAAVVIASDSDEKTRIFLLWIDRARFAGSVPYGARLSLDAHVTQRNETGARVTCEVAVDGRALGSLRFAMGITRSGSSEAFAAGFRVYARYLTQGWRGLRDGPAARLLATPGAAA